MLRVIGWTIAVGLTSLVLAAHGLAQGDPPDPEPPVTGAQPNGEMNVKVEDDSSITITFSKEGMPFDDIVAAAANFTKKQFTYDPRKTANKSIKLVGSKNIKQSDIFSFFQTLFITQDFAIVPLGPPEAEVLLIDDIKTSQFLKQRARFVDVAEVESYSRYVGEVIAVTVPLKFVPVEKAQRALANIIADHRVGFVVTVEESNSLLITNFAPTVYLMFRIIKAMDVEQPENQLNFEKLELEHHVAEELASIIEQLIDARSELRNSGGVAARGNPQQPQPAGIAAPPAPRIIPDPRTNSLLVYAVDEYMREIKKLVTELDTAITADNSNIHIYELLNTNADEIQQVLSELLGQTGGRSTRATGAGGTQGRNQGIPGQQNQGLGGVNGTTNQDSVNIVADPNTNSLLITATRSRFEEVAEIIAKLDKRRPEVLVQTAIVELSDTDLQNIGVEIAQVEGGGAESRFFGGSAFGLSTIDTQSNLNSGGTGGGGTGGGNGNGGSGSVPSNFFDDLVRIPNLDAQGLTAGIFQNFIEVPILIQLFKQKVSGNLVSVPSVLVNDNQEAHIVVGTEVPTTSTNQGQFSDQTSFSGYQEASLELRISPHISNDNYLRLDIFLSVQAFTGSSASTNVPPPRTTREVQTNITVQSGKTVVIGGLTTDNVRETVLGIPFLSDIPVLGEFFKSTSTTHDKTTLYVFLTPTILNTFEALERISYERKLEIAKLEGQILIVDPNFREADLDDEKLSIEEIESSGYLDIPRYRPTTPLTEAEQRSPQNNTDGVPVKPSNGDVSPSDPKTDEMQKKENSKASPADDSGGVRRAGARPEPVGNGR